MHLEFLKQLEEIADKYAKIPRQLSYFQRFVEVNDPIDEDVIKLLAQPSTTNLKYYSLTVTFIPRLKDAIIQAAQRGGQNRDLYQ